MPEYTPDLWLYLRIIPHWGLPLLVIIDKSSARLWANNKKKYSIATGFGLSDDNIWRRHSWLMTVNSDLIETTIAREIYFGTLLDNDIAGAFARFYLN